MRLKDFVNIYNLDDLEIVEIKSINNDLYITFSWEIEMQYMANGCRPEFDYQVTHLFIFKNQAQTIITNNQQIISSEYLNDKLYLKLSNQDIIIKDDEIEIKPNI